MNSKPSNIKFYFHVMAKDLNQLEEKCPIDKRFFVYQFEDTLQINDGKGMF